MTRLAIGIAVGEEVFAACWGGAEWETPLSAGPSPHSIGDAVCQLKQVLGPATRATISVAVLPPLVRMRRIELPSMSEDDLRLAVTTNAQRYFLGLGPAPVCGAVAARRRGRVVSLLAFGASSELIEGIVTAFHTAGWQIDRIVPAPAAWVSFVGRNHPRSRRGAARIGVRLPREVNVLEMETGSLVRVRRLRAGDPFPAIEEEDPWYEIGDDKRSPSTVAARAAKRTRGFEIVPNSLRSAHLARERRVTAVFVVLACASLFGAAVGYRWRLERQLTAIEARRSAIRASASRALTARDSTQRLVARVASIAELEQSAPRWSAVLSRIAIALPADAELLSIRAESDSATIDGQARDASSIVSALRQTPGVKTVRPTSPIVRELSADQMTAERWRVALRLDHHVAVQR